MRMIVLISIFFLAVISHSAVITPYIPPNKVNPEVKVDVKKESDYYIYRYEVTNLPGSEQKIALFGIYIQGDYEVIKDPAGWRILFNDKARVFWAVDPEVGSNEKYEGAMIDPGETLCCFVIRSRYPPVDGAFEAEGDTPIPSAEYDTEIEAQIERDYGKGHNVFGDTKIGYTRVPGPVLEGRIRVVPRVININFTTEGRFTVKVEPPGGYRVEDIEWKSLIFQGWGPKEARNYQNKYLIVVFPKDGPAFMPANSLRVFLWGRLKDGKLFRASDTITVIDEPVETKKKKAPKKKEPLMLIMPVEPMFRK